MPLLNVDQAAQSLGTSPRFIRRLIAERKIAFTKLGKHVRIDSRDLDAFIAAGHVEPATPSRVVALTPESPRQRDFAEDGLKAPTRTPRRGRV